MTDAETTIAELAALVRRFTDERDWAQFHNPKDLGVAMAIEVGEVLEHFRFRTNEQIESHLAVGANRHEFAMELADVLWVLVRLADVADVDLAASLEKKIGLAALKYPAEKVRGLPHKYTHYQSGNESAGSE